jgi:pimeloyl-ACP methyl ester carboxylesterase
VSEPVVLLHAGVCDHRMWDDVAPALRDAGRSVVAPDLRGFGTRPPGVAPFSHAGDVVALLDGIGAERADVVGASFGGRVALEVAALAPDRVRSLALLAPGLREWDYADPELLAYDTASSAALKRGDVDEVARLSVELWARGLSPADQDYVAACERRAAELMSGEAAEEEPAPFDLDAVAAPALVMVGDQDVSDFVAIARHLAGTLPGAELRVVEGAGHLLALERPDDVRDALVTWLAPEE